jgi:hypothetical protein|tara:strand:+ start:976 stop:1185 length:210 start_codon:yes stop_codon:yes gene_type:complete
VIIKNQKNHCEISFSWRERLRILFKGCTKISADGMKHMGNHLIRMYVELDQYNPSTRQHLKSDDEQELK